MITPLEHRRLNAGYSIRGLSRELGVPEQSIRRLEAGLGITPANAKKIADFYGLTVVELLHNAERQAA